MALNIHQLHIFYAVAMKGSFSAAAQALHMTQPAVTMQIQSLEEYFGTKLLHRSTKKLQLSEAGQMLIPYAERCLALIRETEQAMSNYAVDLRGKLQLAASLTIGEYVLPQLLGSFGTQFPDLTLSLKVMNTSQIVEGIRANQLHLGLVEAPITDPDMVIEPVMEDELLVVVPSHHPLADREEVDLHEVLMYRFVLREQGSGTRQVMEEALSKKGVPSSSLQVVMELGSTGAVKSAVEAGIGITMLSPSSVRHELTLGLVHTLRIRDVQFTRKFYAVHGRASVLALPAATFLTFLRNQERMN
ncbi:selenium metabolism-associated LysR family transcriptional regulator [Paenibacillus sp. 481]|uniref:selenium metabolism-associated LysR family transcriptional regulator n=1 Tax=Paenibacillus sp. 481 TaxID=2835869 RepID=UPI001E57D6A8|nr:selenium metabolism-associated LysR family transcriptional regulator [Paenibacillus sp. 481]UHA74046.1 LysR family transcriptional regulator [Paenibacillus sp. 481]